MLVRQTLNRPLRGRFNRATIILYGKRFKFFELCGFNVYVDLSWLIVAAMITWWLARGIFPAFFRGLAGSTYWFMGLAGAAGLFASIVFHEFSHSLIARWRGLQMRGITLFVFGGVAEMADEPPTAASEFWMAIAGPAASVLLAAVFSSQEL